MSAHSSNSGIREQCVPMKIIGAGTMISSLKAQRYLSAAVGVGAFGVGMYAFTKRYGWFGCEGLDETEAEQVQAIPYANLAAWSAVVALGFSVYTYWSAHNSLEVLKNAKISAEGVDV